MLARLRKPPLTRLLANKGFIVSLRFQNHRNLSNSNKETPSSSSRSSDLFNVPNSLTMVRIGLTPVVSYMILGESFDTALAIFWFAGFLDWLDGYFARKLNQKSIFGSFLDPLADKLLVGTSLFTLYWKSLIPLELVALIVLRDIGLVGGSFLIRGLTKPKDVKFFDMGEVSGVLSVKPSMISKVNTLAQFGLIWFTLTAHSQYITLPPVEYLPVLWGITSLTTVLSGLDYIGRNNYKNIFIKKK